MKRLAYLLLVVSVATTACEKDTCNEELAFNYDPNGTSAENCIWEPLTVKVHFNPKFGDEDIVLNTDYTTEDGRAISFEYFGMYLTEMSLKTNDGYITLGDEGLNCVDRSRDALLLLDSNRIYQGIILPDGEITSLRFNVGVDTCRNNNLDPTTLMEGPFAPQFPTMYWAWATGYRFISLMGFVDSSPNGDGSNIEPFQYHTGLNTLLRTVELENPEFTRNGTELSLEVTVDFEVLLNDLDFTVDLVTHTSNNFPLAEKISNNVENAFILE